MRRERHRDHTHSRTHLGAGPRGVARCSTLGSITVFWRPGQSESVLCRAHSRRGQAAIDAYFAQRDAYFAARGGGSDGAGHGESQLEPGGGVFDGVDLIDDDDDGFDAGPYGDGPEDDPRSRVRRAR